MDIKESRSAIIPTANATMVCPWWLECLALPTGAVLAALLIVEGDGFEWYCTCNLMATAAEVAAVPE